MIDAGLNLSGALIGALVDSPSLGGSLVEANMRSPVGNSVFKIGGPRDCKWQLGRDDSRFAIECQDGGLGPKLTSLEASAAAGGCLPIMLNDGRPPR